MTAKPCRYNCGIQIIFLGKTGEPRSTGMFEIENGKVTSIEHTYKRCNQIIKAQTDQKEAIEKEKDAHGGGLEAFSS